MPTLTDDKVTISELKKTKIIATFGPACSNIKQLSRMIELGANIFRLNASHYQDPNDMVKAARLIRRAEKKANAHVAIMLDLQGPKIRLGRFRKRKVELKTGKSFTLTIEKCMGTEKIASINYAGIINDVNVGDPIYLNDGIIQLIIQSKTETELKCKVVRGGTLSNYKGANFPVTSLSMSAFTEKDMRDCSILEKANIDYVALSFVSFASDVENLREYIGTLNAPNVQIIAKIERQLAMDHLTDIIQVSDAIMVARGDLGVEIGVEDVPKSQKHIIRLCNQHIKPVIVATQMLETMISSETATRAEVSDVANAVYDYCDGVMLSSETAVGINPPNVIEVMSNICQVTEKTVSEMRKDTFLRKKYVFAHHTRATSFCKAAEQIAEENDAKAIIAFTSSGTTPLIASKLKSLFPIIAPTDEVSVCQRLALYRGVIPLLLPKKYKQIHRWTDMINIALKAGIKKNIFSKGDIVVITAGIPIGESNGINSIRIVEV